MNDEAKDLEQLDIVEVNKQVLRLAHEELSVEEREALETDILRKYPSNLHDELRKIFVFLVHTKGCQTPRRYNYPRCIKAKKHLHHAIICIAGAAGGFPLCRNMMDALWRRAQICRDTKTNLVHSVSQGRDVNLVGRRAFLTTAEKLKRKVDVVVHASECRGRSCQDPECRRVKLIFRHSSSCQVRLPKGCPICMAVWSLICTRARECKESKCKVPRCRELKERLVWEEEEEAMGCTSTVNC